MAEGKQDWKEELKSTLVELEESLTKRTAIAARRSPDTFLQEAAALELVIDLRKKLSEPI